jgi:hypothetical protein
MVRIESLHSYNGVKWLRALIGKGGFPHCFELRSPNKDEHAMSGNRAKRLNASIANRQRSNQALLLNWRQRPAR